ncbi:MAG: RNA polymerase sigma factor [Ruminococcaceae bacterium]|nr:RNA polymerase sigma factor [Oscillospiraceae bacterium]
MNNEDVLRLFDTYADDAFRLAYSYLGSRPDAEDVVQDVFVKLIRSDISINKGKEKSYILTMVANRCKDFKKSADVVYNAPFDDAVDVGSEEKFDEEDHRHQARLLQGRYAQ